MINDYEIELVKSKFKHSDKLLLIYIYKNYVFGVVSEFIPDLRLPQITRDEMERCLRTDGGDANLLALLSARCIFTPDQAREVKVLEALKEQAFHEGLITRDEIRKIVKEFLDEEQTDADKSSELEPEPERKPSPPTVQPAPKSLSVLDQVSLNLRGE